MKKIKNLFSTPQKAVLSSVCIVAVLALMAAGAVFAKKAISGRTADANQTPEKQVESGLLNSGTVDGNNVYTGDGTTTEGEGKAVNTELITKDEAKKIAYKDADVSASDIQHSKVTLDTDDGLQFYEVDFNTATTEYDYEINAVTGDIIEKNAEPIDEEDIENSSTQSPTPKSSELITLKEAKSIALKDAGVSASNATFTQAHLETDDGIQVYEIDFYTSTTEYDYEINAKTGKIRERSSEPIDDYHVEQPTPAPTSTSDIISLSKAKSIALKDAGVSTSSATFVKAKLEMDDGVQIYDIEFYTTSTEYEYEIDALTGRIRERSSEKHDIAPNETDSGSYISVDKAKAIAVQHAGFSLSEVTFTKAKLENDDGRTEYEIEFYVNGIEYEYTLDAATGKILEYDSERQDYDD